MSSDFFARCGIMHHTRSMLGNTMCGREFIINSMPMRILSPNVFLSMSSTSHGSSNLSRSMMMSQMNSGFLMSQYLDMLFPTSSKSQMCILDEKTAVDIQTAEKREFTAQSLHMQLKAMGLGRRTASGSIVYASGADPGTPMSKAEKQSPKGTQLKMGSESVEAARKSAKDCDGKTVRQLSRLWMYVNGARPVGEGVGIMNGVGLGLNGMIA